MNRRHTRCPRLAILLITVALGLVACLPSAVRAEGALELVQVGWDGKVAMAGWNPVRVRVAGGAADSIVRVEVVLRAKYQTSPQNSVEFPVGAYGEDVSLPAGASKEVTLWVPAENSGGPSIAASIVRATSGGQTLAEVKVDSGTPRTPSWPLIGVLAESPAVARSLSQIELPVQGLAVPLSVAGLSVADLPRSAELLGGQPPAASPRGVALADRDCLSSLPGAGRCPVVAPCAEAHDPECPRGPVRWIGAIRRIAWGNEVARSSRSCCIANRGAAPREEASAQEQ